MPGQTHFAVMWKLMCRLAYCQTSYLHCHSYAAWQCKGAFLDNFAVPLVNSAVPQGYIVRSSY